MKRFIHKISYYSTILSTIFFILWTTGADTPINFEFWQSVWLNSMLSLVISITINHVTYIKNSKYNL